MNTIAVLILKKVIPKQKILATLKQSGIKMNQRYLESQSWPGTSLIFLVVMHHRIMLFLTFFQASSLFWLFRVTRHASKTNFTASKVFLRSSSTLMLASTSTPPPGGISHPSLRSTSPLLLGVIFHLHACGQSSPPSRRTMSPIFEVNLHPFRWSYSTLLLAINLHPASGRTIFFLAVKLIPAAFVG